jgi:hypothetical protein
VLLVIVLKIPLIIYKVKKQIQKIKKINNQMLCLSLALSKTSDELKAEGK